MTAAHGIGSSATEVTVYTGGVAVDRDGNLVIATGAPDRVRVMAARGGRFYQQAMTATDGYTVAGQGTHQVVAASTGTCYGRAMTAGHIYTVTGNGRFGFCGDDGTAIEAELKVS